MQVLSEAEYQAYVEAAVRRLLAIATPLEPGPEVLPEFVAPWALLQRAERLFAATLWLFGGPSDAAVKIIARSQVELAITVAWLRLDPDTHVRLYAAEQSRRELELLPRLDQALGGAADDETARVVDVKRDIVARARELAADRQVRGVRLHDARPRDSLVPSIRDRAEQVDTEAALTAYELLFVPWSEWGHTGSGSLTIETRDGKVTIHEGPPRDVLAVKPLVAAAFAYTLAELSRWLGLGVEAECEALRGGLVRAEQAFLAGPDTASNSQRT